MKISITNPNGVVTYQDTIAAKNKSTSNSSGSDFSTTLKKSIADKLDTVSTYKDIFKEASKKYNVSYNLLTAMAQQESGFNAGATSKSGAMGIMQLMPATAAALGVKDAYDPYENIMAGAKYISEKLESYNGNINLALAAYNAGSGAVEKYGGIPPFEETQNYVKNIRAIMKTGADVPDVNYVNKSASKADLVDDLKVLLSELPETEEYSALRNYLAEINYI